MTEHGTNPAAESIDTNPSESVRTVFVGNIPMSDDAEFLSGKDKTNSCQSFCN